MACFSIFLSGRQGADPKHLAAVGLQTLAEDRSPEYVDVLENGPDGGRGLVAIWRTNDPESDPLFGVDKSRQKWLPVPEAPGRPKGAVWVGYEPQRPPTPACLRRKTRLYLGREVKLCDDNWYMVPEVFAMPHVLGMDPETGEFVRFASDEFVGLSKRASSYAAVICEQIGIIEQLKLARPDLPTEDCVVDFSLKDAWGYACEAIGVNYRMCPEVASCLRLFDEPRVVQTVGATIGLQDILETLDQKKTDSPTVGIPVGSATSCGDYTRQ